MSSYFDSSLLDEYETIVFSPFLGDLYWEYAKWQSFIRWYTILNPKKHYEIWTRQSRKSLYQNIPATIIGFDKDGDFNNYEPEGYKLKGYPQHKKNELEKFIESLYKDCVLVFKPPMVDRDDFFNPKQMDMNLFFKYESYVTVQQLIYNVQNRMSVALCPPKEGLDNLVWKRIYENLYKSCDHIVFLISENTSSIILDNLTPSIYSMDKCRDVFGMNLCSMICSDFVCGDNNNLYFKIAEELKFLKTYRIRDKSSLDIDKILKCNV